MVIDMEKTVSEIHEAHLLLNANLLETKEVAEGAKNASEKVSEELLQLSKATDSNIQKTKEAIIDELEKKEKKHSSELSEAKKYIVHKVEKENEVSNRKLEEQSSKIINQMGKQQGIIVESISSNVTNSINFTKKENEKLKEHIDARIDEVRGKQRDLSAKIAMLSTSVDTINQLINTNTTKLTTNLDEQTKLLRKSQRKWFITLLIVAIIGFFI